MKPEGLNKRKYLFDWQHHKQLFLVDKILGRQFFYTVFDRLVRKQPTGKIEETVVS